MIGAKYKYHNSSQIFTLKEIRAYVYVFACGHLRTDNVFIDLQLAEPFQLNLFQ